MTYTERLNERIDAYIAQVNDLMANKRVFDGIFGLGHHPKNDPCHVVFYEDVKKMVEECVADKPSAEEVDEFAESLLKAEKTRGNLSEIQMMYIPIQGLVLQLIPMMSNAKKQELGAWYSKAVPRRMRFPVQRDVCKALGGK